jgi:hypothetical protein
MQTEINEVEVNGIKYIRKDTAQTLIVSKDAIMVRTQSAGVFYGTLAESNLKEGWVKLKNARRVWYWDGAASLSQLATEGTSKPSNCKFPVPVSEVTLLGVIELIPCTEKAVASLNTVSVWKQ